MRRLTAIMFTDMVGYTALMQEDERRATDMRDRHRSVLREVIRNHGGRIVQFYGDGTLSVFDSAVDGATAALQIQRQLAADPPIPVRIGIHVGDIVHDEDGIHGDGVNVAARIQGLALPRSVLVSAPVSEELKNHPDLPLVELGAFELKNVPRPMKVWALADDALVVPSRSELEASGEIADKSIAVLPFVSMSSDRENEYFADGITEEILNALTHFAGLKVTARTSSFAFKGQNRDIRDIARALDVGFVLEGSVRRAGDRVRITTQLIDASDGYHVFSNTYDRVLEDIFATQDEIAGSIAEELRVFFPDPERPAVRRRPTDDPEAYSLYLKGLHAWNRLSPQASREAIRHFEGALERDPDFALAHTGLAKAYTHLAALGKMRGDDVVERAQRSARRAVALDPRNAEAVVTLGLGKLFYEWDIEGAIVLADRAIELNPGSAEIRHLASYALAAAGMKERWIAECEVAETLDPLSPVMSHTLGRAYLISRRFDDALRSFERALELNPNFRTAREGLAWSYTLMGEHEKALEQLRLYREAIPDGQGGFAMAVQVLAAAGRTQEAEAEYERLLAFEAAHPEESLHMDASAALAALGRHDEALERIRLAVEERMPGLVFMRNGPGWREMSSDPRFVQLLSDAGL